MNWPAIFLACFVVGFVLSALSFALSTLSLHLQVHVPFVHHLHVPRGHGSLAERGAVSPINFATMMAFLVLWSPDENMQSADYRMIGVLGRIGHSIREGGTGELIYSHGGTRHSCGARSADGRAIESGAEVVVTAYDRGIAQVRRWDELAADDSQGG